MPTGHMVASVRSLPLGWCSLAAADAVGAATGVVFGGLLVVLGKGPVSLGGPTACSLAG